MIWWRASGYEIRHGCIVPMVNATLTTYYPWEDWSKAPKRLRTSELTIAPLAKLLRDLDVWAAGLGGVQFELRQVDKLIDWVNANGLLGIALHRVEYVRLAARWRTLPAVGFMGHLTAPMHKWFRYGPEKWHTGSSFAATDSEYQSTFPLRINQSLDGKVVAEDVLVESSRGGLAEANSYPAIWAGQVSMHLSDVWGPFFPSLPREELDSYDYPEPTSEAFWRLYGEPLDEFLREANSLVQAVEQLAQEHRNPPADRLIGTSPAVHACQVLSELAGHTRPHLGMEKTDLKLRVNWSAPSLLAALAMTTINELSASDGNFIRVCEKCRSPFITGDARQLYCSKDCREVMVKRKQRAKHKLEDKK